VVPPKPSISRPHLTPKQTAPQHYGIASRLRTRYRDPDETPTSAVGNLSVLSLTMFFVALLSCARSLKTKSSRWTAALPTGAIHPTTGVKTSLSRRIFGYEKTALNYLVARLLINESDNGGSVPASAWQGRPAVPLTPYERAPAKRLNADLAILWPHVGSSEVQLP
jgi:hypothetical protein